MHSAMLSELKWVDLIPNGYINVKLKQNLIFRNFEPLHSAMVAKSWSKISLCHYGIL